MSLAAYEQRLQALEAAVADLKARQSVGRADNGAGTLDGLPAEAERELVLGVPPKDALQLRAKLGTVQRAPSDLGLSPSEWAALNLESADE